MNCDIEDVMNFEKDKETKGVKQWCIYTYIGVKKLDIWDKVTQLIC